RLERTALAAYEDAAGEEPPAAPTVEGADGWIRVRVGDDWSSEQWDGSRESGDQIVASLAAWLGEQRRMTRPTAAEMTVYAAHPPAFPERTGEPPHELRITFTGSLDATFVYHVVSLAGRDK